MSLWQFAMVCEGYRKAHDPNADKELSAEEEDRLWAAVQARGYKAN